MANNEEEESLDDAPVPNPSSFPEFAHCFSFFKKFGPYLSLPDVTLNELERFFKHGDIEDINDTLVDIQYNLLSYVTRRPIDKETRMFIAAKLAYSNGYIDGTSDYEDFDIHQRIKLLKFLCDIQFVRNSSFKNCLSKIPESNDSWWRERPIGLDRNGLRYWYLQDSTHNIRLYSEDKYLEYPFDHPKWTLVCSSVRELEVFIFGMEQNFCEKSAEQQEHDDPDNVIGENKVSTSTTKKRRLSAKVKKTEDGSGCIVCGKDTFYSKMLLCDKCDKECHTYCQYPIVWSIPDSEWYCPPCREYELIEALKKLLNELREEILMCEKQMEEEQKKLRRLQRGGLLVQNIITEEADTYDDDAPRRSGRTKRSINYALLNELDIHIPTYRPSRPSKSSSKTFQTFSSTNFYNMRRTRHTQLTVLQKQEEEKERDDVLCQLEVTTVKKQQDIESIDSNESFLCSFPLNSLSSKSTVSSESHDPSLSPLSLLNTHPDHVNTDGQLILANEKPEHKVHHQLTSDDMKSSSLSYVTSSSQDTTLLLPISAKDDFKTDESRSTDTSKCSEDNNNI